MTEGRSERGLPDFVPMGMEVEVFADDHGLPLAPWQRSLLLRWFPMPTALWRRKAQCDRCLRYTEVEDGPGPESLPGRFCDPCRADHFGSNERPQ